MGWRSDLVNWVTCKFPFDFRTFSVAFSLLDSCFLLIVAPEKVEQRGRYEEEGRQRSYVQAVDCLYFRQSIVSNSRSLLQLFANWSTMSGLWLFACLVLSVVIVALFIRSRSIDRWIDTWSKVLSLGMHRESFRRKELRIQISHCQKSWDFSLMDAYSDIGHIRRESQRLIADNNLSTSYDESCP